MPFLANAWTGSRTELIQKARPQYCSCLLSEVLDEKNPYNNDFKRVDSQCVTNTRNTFSKQLDHVPNQAELGINSVVCDNKYNLDEFNDQQLRAFALR